MGLLDRFKAAGAALFRPQANATGNVLTEGDIERIWGGRWAEPTIAGPVVTEKNASSVAAVYSCIDLICGTLSHVPLVLYRRDGERRVEAVDDDLYRLLHDQPNDWQSALEFRELMQRDLELRGNAYARIIRGTRGRVMELLRMHPDHVQVEQRADMSLRYSYSRDGQSSPRDLAQEEVFHLRGMGDDGIKGLSPIAQHRQTVGHALALQQHGSRFFSNGAKPGLALQLRDGYSMSEETRKELKEEIQEQYGGGTNAYRTMIIPEGLEHREVSLSMEDAQYIEARQFTRSEIYQVFRVPPHLVSDTEKSTSWGTGIEQLSIGFLVYSMARRFARWEQAIKRDLLRGREGYYARHNVDALLRGDVKSRNEALQIQRRNGVITANQWLEKLDENPRRDPAGDMYIIEENMRYDDGTQLPRPGDGNPNQD